MVIEGVSAMDMPDMEVEETTLCAPCREKWEGGN